MTRQAYASYHSFEPKPSKTGSRGWSTSPAGANTPGPRLNFRNEILVRRSTDDTDRFTELDGSFIQFYPSVILNTVLLFAVRAHTPLTVAAAGRDSSHPGSSPEPLCDDFASTFWRPSPRALFGDTSVPSYRLPRPLCVPSIVDGH